MATPEQVTAICQDKHCICEEIRVWRLLRALFGEEVYDGEL